jgi:hypothetical protein
MGPFLCANIIIPSPYVFQGEGEGGVIALPFFVKASASKFNQTAFSLETIAYLVKRRLLSSQLVVHQHPL